MYSKWFKAASTGSKNAHDQILGERNLVQFGEESAVQYHQISRQVRPHLHSFKI